MKIVCESCGAKYSIADEKVAGKVFKIRCKKCSAVIVVRGDEIPAETAPSAEAQPPEDPQAIWYVVIDGEQQGPFAPSQLPGLLSAGTMDWESYVWRDGFEGWVAAREVPELVQAVGGAPDAGAAAAPASEADSFGDDPFAGPEAASAAAASAEPAPSAAAAQSSVASAVASGAASPAANESPLTGADLFATSGNEPSPFGSPEPAAAADTAISTAAPVATAATPQPIGGATATADEMTGRRSENSVLFSLSNLQALATGGPDGGNGSAAATAAPATSTASSSSSTTEGSGLIDIRALATTNGSAPQSSAGSADNIDDLLSIGTGSPLASSLTAPVLGPAEEEQKGGKGMMLMMAFMGFVVVAAAAVVAVVLITRPAATPTPTLPPQAITPGTSAAVTPTPSENTVAATPQGDVPETTESPTAMTEERPDERTGERRPERPSSMRETTAMAQTPSTSTMMAEAPSMTSMSTASRDISDLIANATMMSSSTMAAAAPDPSLPEAPSRSQVASALRAVSGQVRACGNGQHGQAMTTVVVAGASGRVQSARVQGQFAGTPVGACIARAVRGARFPRFQRSTFSVNFPYVL